MIDRPLLPDYVSSYINDLVPPRPPEMQSMEAYAEKVHFPIIGPACGYTCYEIARMIGARRVFEMGSGYGYSTAWFARAVAENGGGEVFHVVWDPELSKQAKQHLTTLGYDSLVHYVVGEAVETLRNTEGPFDLIFNDIDKEGYADSLPIIAEKLRRGGILIVDNMYWSGRVLDKEDKTPQTTSIRLLTDKLIHSPDWIVSLFPVRDGMVVAYKK